MVTALQREAFLALSTSRCYGLRLPFSTVKMCPSVISMTSISGLRVESVGKRMMQHQQINSVTPLTPAPTHNFAVAEIPDHASDQLSEGDECIPPQISFPKQIRFCQTIKYLP